VYTPDRMGGICVLELELELDVKGGRCILEFDPDPDAGVDTPDKCVLECVLECVPNPADDPAAGGTERGTGCTVGGYPYGPYP